VVMNPYPLPSANIICIRNSFFSQIFFCMFNCFYALSCFCSDLCDLLICTFDAYFIKLFRICIFLCITYVVTVILLKFAGDKLTM